MIKHLKTRSTLLLATALLIPLTACQSGQQTPPPLTTTANPNPRPANNSAPQPALTQRTAPTPGGSQTAVVPSSILATYKGRPITTDQIVPILINGYGLNIVLNYLQLEGTRQEATRRGITVTPDDIKAEMDRTLAKAFEGAQKADYDFYLAQLLKDRHISRAEFDLVIETNTYLRKIAMPMIAPAITDDAVQQAYRELYGETVQVRHIALVHRDELDEVQRRLAAGQPFEKVARELSKNPLTAPLGGELQPFSRTADYPQAFKDAAFSLKEGDVSAPLLIENLYQIVKLERRIPPKAVKFEDVKDSVREDIIDRTSTKLMQALREQIATETRSSLRIEDPVLKKQYDDAIAQRDQQITSENDIRARFKREQEEIMKASTQPSTAPSATGSAPADNSLPALPAAPEVARPPATQSAANAKAAD